MLKQEPYSTTASSREDGLFVTLYPAWAHNPVALLSVCLLAQAHEHAAELVLQFGSLEMSVPFLVQIDRLVQLFESPVLTHVRLQVRAKAATAYPPTPHSSSLLHPHTPFSFPFARCSSWSRRRTLIY